jgi:hypothetical protein
MTKITPATVIIVLGVKEGSNSQEVFNRLERELSKEILATQINKHSITACLSGEKYSDFFKGEIDESANGISNLKGPVIPEGYETDLNVIYTTAVSPYNPHKYFESMSRPLKFSRCGHL